MIRTLLQVLLLPLQGSQLDVNHLQDETGDLHHLDGNHQDITDIMTEGGDTFQIRDSDILTLGEVLHVITALHGSGDPLQGG